MGGSQMILTGVGLKASYNPNSTFLPPPTDVPPVLGTPAQSGLLQRYLTGSGGRWGSTGTRLLNDQIATQLENQGYKIIGGAGRESEEWFAAPTGGTKGGTFVDVTARASDGSIVRVQTIDTLADGVTPTANEAAAAARIRARFPNDRLILVPKPKKP
jgi:filamentous hemagglutinin